MFLKVNQSYHVVVTLASLRPSQLVAKGVAVLKRGIGDGASEGSNSARILGNHVLKDMCLPREVFHAPRDAACGRKWLRAGQPAPTAWKKSAEGTVAAGETSREHHGGLTPAKA